MAGLTYHGSHPPQDPRTGDCYTFTDGVMYVFDGQRWVRFVPARIPAPQPSVTLEVPKDTTFTIPAYRFARRRKVQMSIGKPYGDRQCPVWLPQDPNVPHENRNRCVRWGPHDQHSDTYLIEEQTLD